MDQRELIFLDANIFLELVLEDKNAEKCENLIRKIKDQEIKVKTSDFIVYTCLLQIQQKLKSRKLMQEFILFINELKDLEIIRPSLIEIYDAIKISEEYKLDFDDSLVVSCMKNNNIKILTSFDKDFDKVSIIRREEP